MYQFYYYCLTRWFYDYLEKPENDNYELNELIGDKQYYYTKIYYPS
ncbi:unnamed protein product [Schistosoma mattheei]|uniref:Uncharacterized protein n=1 Tax=Schistosoma mattheei TaxID=31246 RepID=A0A183Q125_9TREM|nr:unnamed protein product [Schistosoma mattheei]